ncbi:sigma-K factor [Mycobacterium phage Saintus]|uniref:DNA binding protein n=1 Tax=Mycobacterium phage Saintus TaxID=2923007 RepID=G8IRD0_9CAUD|nr:sigma-K factor [Mycobacterium phage Saintus]AER26431.1 hypothetical protein SAINTUS_47 [Mycobacterium phage Saintus]
MTTYDELEPVIRRASKSVAFQWPGVVEEDDIYQSIYLRLAESRGSLKKISEMDSKAQYRAIVGIGHQLASEERTDYDYFRGAYNYSVKEVRDLLNQMILVDPPPSFRAELVDMTDSLENLGEHYRDAIVSRYVLGESSTSDAQQKATERAVDALTDEMNKVAKRRFAERDDGPGTRSQVSTEDHYEANDFDFESFASNQGFGWG